MDWTIFWTNFWTILEGGAHHYYWGRGGMKSISTEGGVEGRVLSLRDGCETDYSYAGKGGRWL